MSNQQTNTTDIPKIYDPETVESHWYDRWVESGYFHATANSEREPYTIVIPPPNVTSALHIGHAFNNTVQDVLIRYQRKNGKEALWLPGTDHAGIATQNVVEKDLRKENLSRHDLGREEFVKRVWDWKEKNGATIIRQLKRMGCSCDWDRERFTRDEDYSYAVIDVFIRLYQKGWIYRGKYIINWCPRCETALSDEEVEHEESNGHLWHIRYPVQGTDQHIIVATTRPETMLGDTAVMVHPDDSRYKKLIGKTVLLPLMNREIPIIADPHVDPEFGSGAVKVTPAHDPNDFEVGRRQDLPEINVMHENGIMNANAGAYENLDRFEARKRVVEDLKAQDLLEKVEDHHHSVGHCQRCNTIVEPYLSTQWFVKMNELAKPALDAVVNGDITLYPAKRWDKTYIHWMENVRDWCISRQLWWGHRIPVYYCTSCQEMAVGHTAPDSCENCNHTEFKQDPDVLDTWFSSWLWPFATMGWPEQTDDVKFFYPTQTLVTGPDIIFFWVARMIVSGYEFMDEKPFSDVYLNGIVRDAQGRKMSKSLGNGIDPLVIIEKYSADALRSTLVMMSSEGQDINLAESHFEIGRNFSNKIWNAFRFLSMHIETPNDQYADFEDQFELADRWILSRLNQTIETVTRNLDGFHINDSFDAIYSFFWKEFCDWYLELIKPRLFADDVAEKQCATSVATHVLKSCMHLLHPYIPFITEEIWQRLKNPDEASLVVDAWPNATTSLINAECESQMGFLQAAINGIRTTRSEMNVPPVKKADLFVRSQNANVLNLFQEYQHYLAQLARTENILALEEGADMKSMTAVVLDGAELFIPLAGLIDMDAERQRLEKEIERLNSQVTGLERKLSNEDFLAKAPEQVVQQSREKLNNMTEKLEKLRSSLDRISS